MSVDIKEEQWVECYGDWLVITVPGSTDVVRIQTTSASSPNAWKWTEEHARRRAMAEAIAQFIREHHQEWGFAKP